MLPAPKNISQRRLLATIYITAFFAVGPLLILYATGWRLGNENGTEEDRGWLPGERVAALSVRTVPRGASFELKAKDGTTVESGTSPWIGLNVQPGTYSLGVTKEGYVPITLSLRLRPGQGMQPAHLNLLPLPQWQDKTAVPAPEAMAPTLFNLEENGNCFNWRDGQDGRRYCHPEKIQGTSDAEDGELSWFWSDRWFGMLREGWNEPRAFLAAERFADVSYLEDYFAFLTAERTATGLSWHAWRFTDDGALSDRQDLGVHSESERPIF